MAGKVRFGTRGDKVEVDRRRRTVAGMRRGREPLQNGRGSRTFRIVRTFGLTNWEALAALGVASGVIAAAVPAIWAWSATRSLNQALAFAAELDALSALRGLAPIGLAAVFFGTAIGGVLLNVSAWPMTRRGGMIQSATVGKCLAATGVSAALAIVLGLVSLVVPWEPAAATGAWSILIVALVPAAAYFALRGRKGTGVTLTRGAVGAVFLLIVLSALLGLAQGLRPVPLVSITFEGGQREVVYLVRSEGGVTWFLRPTGSGAILVADRLVMDADTRPITELHVCRVAPTYRTYVCELP